jgi:hypothetical protein
MNHTLRWRVVLLGGAMALGLAWVPMTAGAQDSASGAAAQQDDAQQAQGQGRGRRGGGFGGQGAARNPAEAVDRMREDVNALKLRDEQKGRLDAVFKEASTQAKSLETELQSLQPRDRAQKVTPFMRDLRRNVNGVLDDEQRQALRRTQGARQGRQMAERYKRATAELNLTAEQQTKVDALMADVEKKAGELAAQASGDGAAAGGGGASPDGGGRGQGGPMAGLMRETREKLNAILTAEQRQKLDERMQQGNRRGRRGDGAGGTP